jgi:hypothetical protein
MNTKEYRGLIKYLVESGVLLPLRLPKNNRGAVYKIVDKDIVNLFKNYSYKDWNEQEKIILNYHELYSTNEQSVFQGVKFRNIKNILDQERKNERDK